MKNDDKIEMKFLNMENKQFYENQSELAQSLGGRFLYRAIVNHKFNQVLIAAGYGFTEYDAVKLSRELTGVKIGEIKDDDE